MTNKAQNTLLSVKTAFLLAVSISLLMNLLFLTMHFYGRPPIREDSPMGHVFRLNFTLIRIFTTFLIAFLLYILNFSLIKSKLSSQKWGKVWFILILIAATTVLSVGCSMFQQPFDRFAKDSHAFIFGGFMRDFTISAMVTLSALLMSISEKQQKMVLENEILKAENMKTRFMALKNQVDPHFLFNSLNTLGSLINTDTAKANQYLQQLSFVFRYTLQNKEVLTLEEEMKYTMAYSHLMQIRYGDNLKFVDEVDRKYYPYSIISISLQTLVENAIKHNVVSSRQPMTIVFTTTENATIKVSNPIQPKKEPEIGESIGLANLAERYRLLWNREISIRNANGIFEVEIPLIE
ncbi:MAG: histidine kinase [Dysgonamonadaceae bacterium]|jgi:sensor histidine kinase YesM|nr:histidine kinase [Dysgonamonadaceae bacterium]